MAKNESTAVNELIHRAATMTPLRPDPADDLLFRAPPPPSRQPAALAKQPAPPAPGNGQGIAPLPRTRAAHGTPVDTIPMRGGGAPAALARPPARRPTGTVTMQGIGAVERTAAPLPPPPPPSIDDGWADDPRAGRPPMAAPARSRRTAGIAAQALPSLPSLPKAPPPLLRPRRSQAQPAQSPSMSAQPQPAAPPSMPVAAALASVAMPTFGPAFGHAFGHAKPGSLTTGNAAAIVALDAPVRAPVEPAPERREQAQHGEAWVGTLHVRRSSWKASARKLVAPLVTVTVLGITAGGYFAFYAEGGKRRAPAATSAPVAASPAAAPAPKAPAASPAASTAAAEPAAPAGGRLMAVGAASAEQPAERAFASASAPAPASFVDVMIVSSPAGATVSLVDRDRTLLIGTTPISTALDPSRTYELLFSQPGRATWIEPLDPAKTRRVNVSLGPAAKPAVASGPEGREPAVRARAVREPTAAGPALARPASVGPAAAGPALEAPPASEGILMISSKPPCEIVVDGKPTGLTTPQREIPLPVGTHKITLVNKAERINKTISVQIAADQPTKVIQNLMK